MPRYPIELQQLLEKASLVLISPYSCCSFRFLLFCLLAPFPGPSLCFFGGLKRRGASGDPLEPPARACGPLIPPSFFRLFLRMDVVPYTGKPKVFFFTSSLDVYTGASPARIGRRRGSPRCRARPAGVRATAAGPPSTGAGGGGSSGPAGGRGSVRALLGCATVPAVGASWRRLLGCHGRSSGCGRRSPAPAL